jgi:MFS family permease
MEKANVASNIWKLYLIKAIRSGMFSIPVIVLFFQENGLSMREIIFLQASFSFIVIAFEVPTGHFADTFGRKKSILIGSLLSTVGYLVYASSHGFAGFLIGETILGIGACFVSGADGALLYDTLQENDQAKRSIKTEGKSSAMAGFAEALTSFIGGTFLVLVSLRFTLYCDAMLALLVFPVALTLTETKRHTLAKRENALKKMWRLMKYSLHEHAEIKWLIIYSALAGAATLSMVWFIQVYWKSVGISVSMFGVLWASLQIVFALVAINAHSIEKKLGRKTSLVILMLLPVIGFAVLSVFHFAWAAAFIILFYVVRGLNDPVAKTYINGLVSSEERATILSVKSLVCRMMFAIIGPLLGWMHDAYSLSWALGLGGMIFAFSGMIALIFLHKHKAL